MFLLVLASVAHRWRQTAGAPDCRRDEGTLLVKLGEESTFVRESDVTKHCW